MRRDDDKYQKAREYRRDGESIRAISKKLRISSSTASIWCRDVELSSDQLRKLAAKGQNRELLNSYARKRHEEKLEHMSTIYQKAKMDIQTIQNKELFLVGLALYWAEGFKSQKETQVGFCNSDPRMIECILRWFQESLKISKDDFVLRVEFNITHKTRENVIERYWSNLTGIPRSQFNKPYLQKAKLLRKYSNKENYYGVLRIRIRKSSNLLVRLRGWIDGLALA